MSQFPVFLLLLCSFLLNVSLAIRSSFAGERADSKKKLIMLFVVGRKRSVDEMSSKQ